jgi:hypothetical protein
MSTKTKLLNVLEIVILSIQVKNKNTTHTGHEPIIGPNLKTVRAQTVGPAQKIGPGQNPTLSPFQTNQPTTRPTDLSQRRSYFRSNAQAILSRAAVTKGRRKTTRDKDSLIHHFRAGIRTIIVAVGNDYIVIALDCQRRKDTFQKLTTVPVKPLTAPWAYLTARLRLSRRFELKLFTS